jgi:D-methionine transport system substrate-binding protein
MKKGLSIVAATICLVGILSGCAGKESPSQAQQPQAPQANKTIVLKVGATPVPHAEILKEIKPILAKKGIDLKVTEFNDYVTPNNSLENKEIDANFFQHVPYLDSFNKDHGTHLVPTVKVHFEPLGLYAGKSKSLKSIPNGAVIAVPNDPTNEARALLLLSSNGIIKMPKDAGLKATPKDIAENPHKITFKEMDAAFLARTLSEVDYAVVNGNFANQAGLKVKDALLIEDKNSVAAQTFANVIAVRKGDENRPEIKALDEAITSADVKKFIETKYQGSVVPVF